MKRHTLKALAAAIALGAIGLSPLAQAQDKGSVGISMPTKSSARWIADGDNMVKVLKERGYKTDLQYAEDDIPNQLAQIENMITKGVKVLGDCLHRRHHPLAGASKRCRQRHQGHRL